MTDPSQYIAALEAVMRDRGYRDARFTDDGLTHSGGVVDDAIEIAGILANADKLIQVVCGVMCDLGGQYLERLPADGARRTYEAVKNGPHVNLSPECVDDFRAMIGAERANNNQSSRT